MMEVKIFINKRQLLSSEEVWEEIEEESQPYLQEFQREVDNLELTADPSHLGLPSSSYSLEFNRNLLFLVKLP